MSSARRRLVGIVAAFVAVVAVGGTVWALDDNGAGSATATTATSTSSSAPATTTSTTVATHEHEHEHDAGDATACVVAGVEIHPPGHTGHAGMTIHDATDSTTPTPDDCAHAQAFYAQVSAAAVRYEDIDAATADGFVPGPRAATNGRPVDHYFLRARDPAVLDATKPEGLVYWVDGDTATLLGFLFMEHDDANLQQPGGPYTVWHDHGGAVKMFHVWVFDGVKEPFALSYVAARSGTT